jgi:ribosomal protein S18 acetylase RimI-like enzyme
MARIRPAEPGDLEAVYEIALKTGDNGADASALHDDPRLVGHIYAAPYLTLSRELAFVVEDAEGVAGYIVGARDTRAFEVLLEDAWWPTLRARYAEPVGTDYAAWSADQRRIWLIHHPYRTPDKVVEGFPAHLHINLLPRLQGQGAGKGLMDAFLDALRRQGAPGVHLGTGEANRRARRFYEIYGFETLQRPPGARNETVWMRLSLGSGG